MIILGIVLEGARGCSPYGHNLLNPHINNISRTFFPFEFTELFQYLNLMEFLNIKKGSSYGTLFVIPNKTPIPIDWFILIMWPIIFIIWFAYTKLHKENTVTNFPNIRNFDVFFLQLLILFPKFQNYRLILGQIIHNNFDRLIFSGLAWNPAD